MLVQPMRYCYTFTTGSLEANLANDDKLAPNYTTNHWTEDGFKARVLELHDLHITIDGNEETEEYAQVKIFGQGRKHFTMRNGEKTKVVWIQKRLVSRCREDN